METTLSHRPKGRPRKYSHTPQNKLREYREKVGWTQKDCAEFLGVLQSQISEAECTDKGLGHEYWRRLAEHFNVDQHILQGIPLHFAKNNRS